MKRISALMLLLVALAQPAHARWNCSVREELSPNLPASMDTLVSDDGSWRTFSFRIHWVPQPGHMALQTMSWTGIPRGAERLWKPDAIELGIRGTETDMEGWVAFRGPVRVDTQPAREIAHWLPDFSMTWVSLRNPYWLARIWWAPEARWQVEHRDRRGMSLGEAEILLPGAAVAQTVFTRLQTQLERKAADPEASGCYEIPEPTQWELEQEQINWGRPIPRPNLESVTPLPEFDEEEEEEPQGTGQLGLP